MIKKEIIQEAYNPSKGGKVDSIINFFKHNNNKTPPPFKNKQDCIGGTNEKKRESDNSPSDTDGSARNPGNEHKNEEDEEYI